MWPCVFKCTRRFFLFVWPISRVRARRRPKLLFTKQERAWWCLQWDLFPLWLAANFFFSKKDKPMIKKSPPSVPLRLLLPSLTIAAANGSQSGSGT